MKIHELELQDFKGFEKVQINFEEPGESIDTPIMFFLGENGSGKTSIFEALMLIFSSVYSPKLTREISFDYIIKYTLNDLHIELRKNTNEYLIITTKREKKEMTGFRRFVDFRNWILSRQVQYIPQKIVTSYSGINDRLGSIYQNVQVNYKRHLTKNNSNNREETDHQNEMNKVFVHSRDEDVSLFLPVIWFDDDRAKKILKETCYIDKLSEIEIQIGLTSENLKKIFPLYSQVNYNEEKEKFDNDRENTLSSIYGYNYVENSKVELKKMLKKYLYEEVLVGVEYSSKKNTSPRIKIKINLENYFGKGKILFDLMSDLKSQFGAGVDIFLVKNGKKIVFRDLSEGEYQLIRIIGMLILTKDSSGLVLLDEPDVHLSSRWKYKFREFLDKLLEDISNTQVLINTHDPLVVNGSKAEEVRIIQLSENQMFVEKPYTDAIGKGIDGLLRSRYFNLDTTLDYTTLRLMKKREDLSRKYKLEISTETAEDELSEVENELRKLNKKINSLSFNNSNYDDELYKEYLEALQSIGLNTDLKTISQRDLDERKEKIKDIILEMVKK